MSDAGRRLISKILIDENLSLAVERGISEEHFPDSESKRVWSFLIKHYTQYQDVPSAVTVKKNYPTYQLLNVKDTLPFLLDEVVREKLDRATYATAQEVVQLLSAQDYEGARAALRSSMMKMDASTARANSTVDLTLTTDERLRDYLSRAQNKHGIIGIPTGYVTIDKATQGLQPEQLTTFVAGPKTGKSTLLMSIACHVHDQGYKVLMQSFEMSNREQQERHDAMRAHIHLSKLRDGSLDDDAKQELENFLDSMKGLKPFILEDTTEGMTVSGLISKITRHQSDVVFVDGVYLMHDEISGEAGTPRAITNITRALKRTAQALRVPIVISTQTLLWKMKNKQTSAESIGYSSSFVQDSDVVMGLDRDEARDYERTLKIIASRNSGTAETVLLWDWSNGNFGEISPAMAADPSQVDESQVDEDFDYTVDSSAFDYED